MRLIDKLLQKRKERIEKRANTPQFGFFQRFASTILIFLLFLTQTIHVDFFDSAVAESDEYRDIVSIIVDDETYSALGGAFGFSNKVSQYAEDIQKYL